MPAVIVRQRKPYKRKNGLVLYFEGNDHQFWLTKLYIMFVIDNAGVIVNNKGEMKGILYTVATLWCML